jgi:hypothetical protein
VHVEFVDLVAAGGSTEALGADGLVGVNVVEDPCMPGVFARRGPMERHAFESSIDLGSTNDGIPPYTPPWARSG